jgi:hypothetical protein
MARKRINSTAICSSANYVASRGAHREHINMLKRNHEENKDILQKALGTDIEVRVEVKVTFTQARVFGKWIDINPKDIDKFNGFKLR